MVSSIVEFLDHWQTLVGAMLGGLVGLWAALIVARAQTRRDLRAAAYMLSSELTSISAIWTALREAASKNGVAAEQFPMWATERLAHTRPRLSPKFDSYLVRLMGVDTPLAAHLDLFGKIYATIDDVLPQIEEDVEWLRTRGGGRSAGGGLIAPRHPDQSKADMRSVVRAVELAAKHADCALHLIQVLIFGRVPPALTRARMRLLPSAIERESRQLLRTGRLAELDTAARAPPRADGQPTP